MPDTYPQTAEGHVANIAAGSAFHEKLAESWSRGYAAGSFRRRLLFLKQRLNGRVRPGALWLDAGCGSGVIARELDALGAAVIAVDASPKMLAQALEDTHATAGRIDYQLIESVERLPLQDGVADGVLCSSVLEYVENPDAALRECCRVLGADGCLIVSVPNRWSVIRMAQQLGRQIGRLVGKSLFDYLSVSRHSYSRGALRKALSRNGFDVEEIALFSPVQPRVLTPLGLGALWVAVAHRKPSPSLS
jgi:2-polyprenyl-3-methyl-5-hydroxy-6-metoxy-1,4-benzoquinol methylase